MDEVMGGGGEDGNLNLTDFVGGIALGLAGLAGGVAAGVRVDGNAFPVLLGCAGLLAGGFLGRRLTRRFPRLRSGTVIRSWAAGCGMSGMLLGFFAGDYVGALAGVGRVYPDVVGAGLGLYLGIRIGLARSRRA